MDSDTTQQGLHVRDNLKHGLSEIDSHPMFPDTDGLRRNLLSPLSQKPKAPPLNVQPRGGFVGLRNTKASPISSPSDQRFPCPPQPQITRISKGLKERRGVSRDICKSPLYDARLGDRKARARSVTPTNSPETALPNSYPCAKNDNETDININTTSTAKSQGATRPVSMSCVQIDCNKEATNGKMSPSNSPKWIESVALVDIQRDADHQKERNKEYNNAPAETSAFADVINTHQCKYSRDTVLEILKTDDFQSALRESFKSTLEVHMEERHKEAIKCDKTKVAVDEILNIKSKEFTRSAIDLNTACQSEPVTTDHAAERAAVYKSTRIFSPKNDEKEPAKREEHNSKWKFSKILFGKSSSKVHPIVVSEEDTKPKPRAEADLARIAKMFCVETEMQALCRRYSTGAYNHEDASRLFPKPGVWECAFDEDEPVTGEAMDELIDLEIYENYKGMRNRTAEANVDNRKSDSKHARKTVL